MYLNVKNGDSDLKAIINFIPNVDNIAKNAFLNYENNEVAIIFLYTLCGRKSIKCTIIFVYTFCTLTGLFDTLVNCYYSINLRKLYLISRYTCKVPDIK